MSQFDMGRLGPFQRIVAVEATEMRYPPVVAAVACTRLYSHPAGWTAPVASLALKQHDARIPELANGVWFSWEMAMAEGYRPPSYAASVSSDLRVVAGSVTRQDGQLCPAIWVWQPHFVGANFYDGSHVLLPFNFPAGTEIFLAPSGNFAVATVNGLPGQSWRLAIDKKTAAVSVTGPWPLWACGGISDDGKIISGQINALRQDGSDYQTQVARVVVSTGALERIGPPPYEVTQPTEDGQGVIKETRWSGWRSSSLDGRVITSREYYPGEFNPDYGRKEMMACSVHFTDGAESWRGDPVSTDRGGEESFRTQIISGNGVARIDTAAPFSQWLVSHDGRVVWPESLPGGAGFYPAGSISAVPIAGAMSAWARPVGMDASGLTAVFLHVLSQSAASGVLALHSPSGALLDVIGGAYWAQNGAEVVAAYGQVKRAQAIPYRFSWSLK